MYRVHEPRRIGGSEVPVSEEPRQDIVVESVATQAIAPRHALIVDPAEVTHYVCCRAEPWEVAMCGYDVTHADLNFDGDACAMCNEVVHEMWRSRGGGPLDEHCPYSNTPCPSDEWLFNRVARETT